MSLGQAGGARGTRVHPRSRLLVAISRFFPLQGCEREGRARGVGAEGAAGGSGRPAGREEKPQGIASARTRRGSGSGCPCGAGPGARAARLLSASGRVCSAPELWGQRGRGRRGRGLRGWGRRGWGQRADPPAFTGQGRALRVPSAAFPQTHSEVLTEHSAH